MKNYNIKESAALMILFVSEAYELEDIRDAIKTNKLNISDDDISLFISNKEKAIENIDYKKFTYPQKVLLAVYIHFYFILKSAEINNIVAKVLELLGLTNDLSDFILNNIKSIDLKKYADKKTVIKNIINPSDELTKIGASIVFEAVKDGSFIKKYKISNLSSKEYEHPLDRYALNALQGTPGLETLIRKFNQYGIEKMLKIQYTGSNIKVTESNFPRLYKAMRTACSILEVEDMPDMYMELGFINAFTSGVEKPILVVTSGCLGLLDYDELLFVIGHEIGHIKSQHVLYHQMASVLPLIGSIAGGIGNWISTGLQIALLNWQRKSEFTADRAGLLVCQNINAATTAMMKLAGYPPTSYNHMNVEEFIKQANEFEGFDDNTVDKIVKGLSVMYADHPWTVMRGAELQKWIDSGDYNKILNRTGFLYNIESASGTNDQKIRYCTNCGAKVNETDKFCLICGQKLDQ